MEIEQKECIPNNIRDQIQRQIENWEMKDKLFVSTRASDFVQKCLNKNSCLTLTAPSGVGKSFIARHTALLLQKDGYKIIPVNKPDDIRNYYQPGKQTVFVVDDICGNFTANQQQIDKWKQLLPVVDTIIADTCCKVIVSCRLQVYRDDKFNILSPFKLCECNLIADELCLTTIEKSRIANKYIDSGLPNIYTFSHNCEFFPLLCSLYNKENHGDVTKYFQNPFIVYKEELKNLNSQGNEGKCKKCCLALAVLFNNQLREKWFLGKISDEQTQIIKDTCEACGINSIPKINLKTELDTLVGTFVSKQDGIYRTIHDKLFDFLAYYFGQKIIECLIEHGDSELVHGRFIWQTSPDDENSNIDFIIEISDDHLELYLERFIKDWLAGKVAVVFSNYNIKVSSFRQQLIQYLQQLDKVQQVKLANTNDTVEPKESCDSGTTPLVSNCYDGYTDMVQWMLRNDVVVDQCRDSGTSGLHMASQEGHTDIVKLLLERNPDVNLCNKDGSSPISKASQNGHIDIVKLLLERNADVNLCNKDGSSPLLQASQNGHTDRVKLLLERNPDVNLCNKNGSSPILMASQNGHTDIVKLLLERNADVNLCNKDGLSPLLQASQNGHTDIVKLLLERKPDVNLCNKDGLSPLLQASQNGHTDIVKILLERNPDVNLCDNDGCSPLIIASLKGHTDIVRLLLERNPDPCNYNTRISNSPSLVQPLLKHKPDINAKTSDGGNALYFSAWNGHIEITQLQLENSADCNICIHSKQSMTDIFNNHPDITLNKAKQNLFDSLVKNTSSRITEYVNNGADTQICRMDEKFPLDIATENGHTSIVMILTKHMKKAKTVIITDKVPNQ
ncbi:uncharacterized protein LOC143050940 [Mytilus galloprovincialis]|uniref:uncharacterized protein LOC143050940 n=1 Tax=Mytilus galloprovincialis TaxID=29158 RepID=UPI003F7CA6C7